MDHPDWPAFVAAIVADPDDDTARLVAADFLEEHGDPDRAAFVRAQVQLARLEATGRGKSLEADELRKKERAFLGPLSMYPSFWAAEECPELVRVSFREGNGGSPLGDVQVTGVERLGWRRGFVESVTCPAAVWLRHGASVRTRQPVREVFLTGCDRTERDDWYAGLPALRGLRTVSLDAPDLLAWLRVLLSGVEVGDRPS